MLVYIAAPLFTDEDKKINEKIASILREKKANVYLPQEYKIDNGENLENNKWSQAIFEHDMKMLKLADIVIAVIRHGKSSDDGTSFEIGYACASGKTVIVLVDKRKEVSLMFRGCQIIESSDFFDDTLDSKIKSNHNTEIYFT